MSKRSVTITGTSISPNPPNEEPEIEVARLREALDESVRIQSHYAILLNEYDGGKRLIFKSSTEWIERLEALKDLS